MLRETHLNGTPLVELSLRTTRFLMHYGRKKAQIPTDSLWYQQIYRHTEWYRTDDSRLSIATQTGTSVAPEIEVNHEWLEERLVVVMLDCLAVNIRNAHWENALAALQHIESYAVRLSTLGWADRAFTFYRQACSRITDAIKGFPDELEVETAQKVAVAESLASIPIAISLALRERFTTFHRADVIARVEAIDWSNPNTYYRAGFADYVLKQIEYLAPRLDFERAVEGKEISPSWYLGELIVQPEAKHFVEGISVLIAKLPGTYASLREAFSAAGLHWMTAATLSRQWEYWHKLDEQVAVWARTWSEMSDGRKLKGLPWAKFDITSTGAELKPMKTELLKAMASLQMQLSTMNRPQTYPDYAGQFLHFSGEAVLEALLTEDAELLKDVFRRYFAGCLNEYGKLQSTDGPEWQVMQNLRLAAAPALDLMNVSGYALLLSELHANKYLWRIVRSTWDEYLADNRRLPAIVAMVKFVESGLGISPREILRTTWQRRVEEKLQQLPRQPAADTAWYMANETETVHASPLVRAMASRTHALDYDGIDIFIALYLARKPGAETLSEHWQRRSLADELSVQRYDDDTPPGDQTK